MKDLYNLEHIIQKVVDLVSRKMIAWALKHTPTIMSRNNKINPESREQVSFLKEESVRKIEPTIDIESLQQEINILKTISTMYARPNVGVIALTHSSTFHMPSLFTQKLYKIQ